MDTFQFQTGSIKRDATHFYVGDNTTFQFQTGSIKRGCGGFVAERTSVSIPNWCD